MRKPTQKSNARWRYLNPLSLLAAYIFDLPDWISRALSLSENTPEIVKLFDSWGWLVIFLLVIIWVAWIAASDRSPRKSSDSPIIVVLAIVTVSLVSFAKGYKTNVHCEFQQLHAGNGTIRINLNSDALSRYRSERIIYVISQADDTAIDPETNQLVDVSGPWGISKGPRELSVVLDQRVINRVRELSKANAGYVTMRSKLFLMPLGTGSLEITSERKAKELGGLSEHELELSCNE